MSRGWVAGESRVGRGRVAGGSRLGRGWVAGGGADRQADDRRRQTTDAAASRSIPPPTPNEPRDEIYRGDPPPLRCIGVYMYVAPPHVAAIAIYTRRPERPCVRLSASASGCQPALAARRLPPLSVPGARAVPQARRRSGTGM